MSNTLIDIANNQFEYTRDLRRDLHRHPELGFKEYRTADIVSRELRRLGLRVQSGVAETGILALMESGRPGPTVLLRFDMDALPIQEETGLEFASEIAGVMHACGHDGHVAVGLTVARILNEFKAELSGSIKFMFQPAEEGLGGAERMIAEGVLRDPRVDAALAMHLWNDRPVGWVASTSGPIMPGADFFSIRVAGKGGHGALPNQTVDPIVAAAEIISALQTIVARNVSPLKSAVVSVTQVTAGSTYNIIPSEAEIHGTIRTFEDETRDLVLKRIEQLAGGIAVGFGCDAEFEIRNSTPAVNNDPEITRWVDETIKTSFQDLHLESRYRTMVSEDMALVLRAVPGCFLLIGSGEPEPGVNYGHHHPKFTIDENVLPIAAALLSAAAMDILQHLNNPRD